MITALYGQYDGYISGHGRDLANILRGGRVVNGYRNDGKEFNGVGCLAAQIVSALKDGVGGYYIYPSDAEDEGYTYDLEVRKAKAQTQFLYELEPEIQVSVREYGKTVFTGPHTDFVQWAFLEETEDEEDLEENR